MTIRILEGDSRQTLRELERESVHAVVTSPPYWGLRDYGTGRWEGGEPGCEHRRGNARADHSGAHLRGRGEQASSDAARTPMRERCTLCGAVRIDSQLGLEPTPAEYVRALADVMDEVRRVLRDDGTLWLNLGDAYSHGGSGARDTGRWPKQSRNDHKTEHAKKATGLRPKSLLGLPWRVALAMSERGWILRSDIVWHKPNPMPESVRDRPTKAHEYVFLFAKSERYFYDAHAIAEPFSNGPEGAVPWGKNDRQYDYGGRDAAAEAVGQHRHLATGTGTGWTPKGEGRNARTVWTIGARPYPGAHFAVFPVELARRCILAGCPKGGVVLDPFAGTGTVGEVAATTGRDAILCELNPLYIAQMRERFVTRAPLLAREAS